MKNSFNFSDAKQVLIFGAGHGIGLHFVYKILETNTEAKIIATYRNEGKAQELLNLAKENKRLSVMQLDPSNEQELDGLQCQLQTQKIKLDAIISTIGFLQSGDITPEKSLRDINASGLIEYFKINSITIPLIAKYFTPFLKKEETTCMAILTAKVGSIEDNKLGGWYGYRASKAAANMFIKTLSLELKNKKYNTIVLALHPGTVDTDLSKPFQKGIKHYIQTPTECVKNIFNVIHRRTIEETGLFFSWDGDQIPW